MESLLDPMAWLSALGIFLVRVLNIALDTVRMISVMRGKKRTPGYRCGESRAVCASIGWSCLIFRSAQVAHTAWLCEWNIIGMNLEKKMAMGYLFDHHHPTAALHGGGLPGALCGNGDPDRGKTYGPPCSNGGGRKDWSKQSTITILTQRVHHLPILNGSPRYWGGQRG
jgi:hypothetical protein